MPKYVRKQTKPLFELTPEDIFEEARELWAERLGVNVDRVTLDARFIEELETDSLDRVEVVMAVEEHFDVDIEDEEAEEILTVQQGVDVIFKKLQEAAAKVHT